MRIFSRIISGIGAVCAVLLYFTNVQAGSMQTQSGEKAASVASLVVGSPAPDFAVTDVDGNKVSLQQLKGRIVVLEWTNHLCPFVRKHYDSGNMQETQSYAKDNDVTWISVISSAKGKQGYVSDKEARENAHKDNAVPSHIIRDASGQLGQLYHAKTTPHIFVIDKDGKLAYMGAIDDIASVDQADVAKAVNYAKATINALKQGEEPEISVTSPYGCSVKYDY